MVEHILHACLPIPPGSAVWEHPSISRWIQCVLTGVYKIVVAQCEVAILDLVKGTEHRQWLCIVIQTGAPAFANINFASGRFAGYMKLLDGLPWFGGFVEGFIYALLEHRRQGILLEGVRHSR